MVFLSCYTKGFEKVYTLSFVNKKKLHKTKLSQPVQLKCKRRCPPVSLVRPKPAEKLKAAVEISLNPMRFFKMCKFSTIQSKYDIELSVHGLPVAM
jgi:hypothetical protein